MRSRAAFLDLREAAIWISAQLQKEGLIIADDVVLRILNRETRFLVMVGLGRAGDEHGPQSGHILREGHWVLEPSAESERDRDIESEGGEQDEEDQRT